MSLSIALTKGRLEKQTVAMLEELGYGVEALKDKEQLVVASEKVQNALKKYKEKTSNETIKKNCPKPVPFSF